MKKINKITKTWQEQLEQVVENHDGRFGHNFHLSLKEARKYFGKIEKIADEGFPLQITIPDYYTAKIRFFTETDEDKYFTESQEIAEVLLYILISDFRPSEARYNKKKDELVLEWHY